MKLYLVTGYNDEYGLPAYVGLFKTREAILEHAQKEFTDHRVKFPVKIEFGTGNFSNQVLIDGSTEYFIEEINTDELK